MPRDRKELTLDPTPQVKAAWSREIERRVREIDDRTVELVDWENVRAELFADDSNAMSLTAAQREELERRWIDLQQHPDDEEPWDEVGEFLRAE